MKCWHVYEMDSGRLVGSFERGDFARTIARTKADEIDDTVKLAYGTHEPPAAIDDADELTALGFVLETFHPTTWNR